MARPDVARAYYAALDDGDYDALADLLARDFVHDRPDRTLEGRERFVRFMREERPNPDTRHEIDAVVADGARVVVEGRLLDGEPERGVGGSSDQRPGDGDDPLVRFCDVFAFDSGRVERLTTYTK